MSAKKIKARRIGPSLEPQDIDENCWYYEFRKYLHFVVWVEGRDGRSVSQQIKVPWRMLMASAKRCMPRAGKLAGARALKSIGIEEK